MKKEIFATLVERLVTIEPNESPLISCFINLEHPRADHFLDFKEQVRQISRQLSGTTAIDFEDALDEIKDYVENKVKPNSKSVAIYSRWGEYPVFIPMEFEVPLKSSLIVDSLPHIYPLIELKDIYHRFVVAILTENEARILETTIGSVTEEILESKPELRQRVGREWTKEHYRNYREEQTNRFVKEKIDIIDNLMQRGGHNHLIIAGSPKMVAKLKQALPSRLKPKLIDAISANPSRGISPILADSLKLFIAMEDIESHSKVNELESAVFSNGLGVCGTELSLKALEDGYASMLIVDKDGMEREVREEMVRLAVKSGIPIETVNRNEKMTRLGGVGCLLRYNPLDVVEQQALVAA